MLADIEWYVVHVLSQERVSQTVDIVEGRAHSGD